jgi:hypothetical protein
MFKLIRRLISLILAVVIIIPTYALFVTWNAAKNPEVKQVLMQSLWQVQLS